MSHVREVILEGSDEVSIERESKDQNKDESYFKTYMGKINIADT